MVFRFRFCTFAYVQGEAGQGESSRGVAPAAKTLFHFLGHIRHDEQSRPVARLSGQPSGFLEGVEGHIWRLRAGATGQGAHRGSGGLCACSQAPRLAQGANRRGKNDDQGE